jgi:hypothetical protein
VRSLLAHQYIQPSGKLRSTQRFWRRETNDPDNNDVTGYTSESGTEPLILMTTRMVKEHFSKKSQTTNMVLCGCCTFAEEIDGKTVNQNTVFMLVICGSLRKKNIVVVYNKKQRISKSQHAQRFSW